VNWQFYKATIASFDVDKLEYTVNFDDGDVNHRQQVRLSTPSYMQP
jgi:hypothetical protein